MKLSAHRKSSGVLQWPGIGTALQPIGWLLTAHCQRIMTWGLYGIF
uniref:Uncharacterized protein n=1 Tax=Anguilla anguilla TaxID=7936 RepID=A0A0E9V744_ANGAN